MPSVKDEKQLRLNLGSFDQCVDLLEMTNDGYLVPNYKSAKSLHYNSHDGEIVYTSLTGDAIQVPIFDVGTSIVAGRIDDPGVCEQLLYQLELRIFAMIDKLVEECGGSVKLENITISVRRVQVFDEDKHPGCYGWAEIGLVAFV